MSQSTRPAAFMSYARADDAYGTLTAFRTRLATEVRLHLGREFPIFQDREDLEWGEEWRSRIEGALSEVTFLIPILTPSFFASDACRDELRQFLARERRLGRQDLVLPVYYISTPQLENAATTAGDELASVLASRQRADWRELRYEALDSPGAARAMARLAEQVRSGLERMQRGPGGHPTRTDTETSQPITVGDPEAPLVGISSETNPPGHNRRVWMLFDERARVGAPYHDEAIQNPGPATPHSHDAGALPPQPDHSPTYSAQHAAAAVRRIDWVLIAGCVLLMLGFTLLLPALLGFFSHASTNVAWILMITAVTVIVIAWRVISGRPPV